MTAFGCARYVVLTSLAFILGSIIEQFGVQRVSAQWLSDLKNFSMKVTSVRCSNGNTAAACQYRACQNYDTCDPARLLAGVTGGFVFDGPYNGNSFWEVTVQFSSPLSISRWRLKTMRPSHGLRRAILKDANDNFIPGSEAIAGCGREVSSELMLEANKKGLEHKFVKVYVTDANMLGYRMCTDFERKNDGAVVCKSPTLYNGFVKHSAFQLYLYDIDFQIGSGCLAGYYPIYKKVAFTALTVEHIEKCEECPAGFYSSDGAYDCKGCSPGRYSHMTKAQGSVFCQSCPAGFTSNKINSSSCSKCIPGRSTQGNTTKCTKCQRSMYQDEYGAALCKSCGSGGITMVNGAASRDMCEFKSTHTILFAPSEISLKLESYSSSMTTSQQPLLISWRINDKILIENDVSFQLEISSTDTFSSTLLLEGLPANQTFYRVADIVSLIKEPMWKKLFYVRVGTKVRSGDVLWSRSRHTWSTSTDCIYGWLNDSSPFLQNWQCERCPTGSLCSGTPWPMVKARFGYYRLPSASVPQQFIPCMYPVACLGAPNSAWRGQFYSAKNKTIDYATLDSPESCNEELGFQPQSRLCVKCKPGYASITGFRCAPCSTKIASICIFSIGLILGLISLVFLIRMSISETQRRQLLSESIKKVILNYLQVITQFSGFSLSWPPIVMSIFDLQGSAGTLGLNAIQLECLLGISGSHLFYGKQIVGTLIPVIGTTIIYTSWRLVALCKGRSFSSRKEADNNVTLKDKCVMSVCLVLFLLYPTLRNQAFAMFQCVEVETGRLFLVKSIEEECYGDQHLWMTMTFGLFQVIAYVIGFPLLGLFVLFRNRSRHSVNYVRVRYGLLFQGYRSEIYYWEAVLAVRKVSVIMLGVLGFSMSVTLQAHILSLVIFINIVAQAFCQPHLLCPETYDGHFDISPQGTLQRYKTVHFLETLGLLTIWITLWNGVFIHEINQVESVLHQISTITIATCNVMIILYMLWHLISELISESKEQKSEQSRLLSCLGKYQLWIMQRFAKSKPDSAEAEQGQGNYLEENPYYRSNLHSIEMTSKMHTSSYGAGAETESDGEEWKQEIDPDSGCAYWYNTRTLETGGWVLDDEGGEQYHEEEGKYEVPEDDYQVTQLEGEHREE